MREKIQDERIIQEAYKQNNIAFIILYFGLLLDLLYRQFIVRESISGYWDLALLFFGVTFYLGAKRVTSGLHTHKLNFKSIIPLAIIATIVYSAVIYWYFDNTDISELLIEGVIFFIVFYAVNLLMQYVSSKKNKDMLKD